MALVHAAEDAAIVDRITGGRMILSVVGLLQRDFSASVFRSRARRTQRGRRRGDQEMLGRGALLITAALQPRQRDDHAQAVQSAPANLDGGVE
jgi:hypothetical protein